ncbi:hypothetical protein OFO01_06970 [Campylobacter sp. JMF_01 NE2]|uniref:sigma factor-like helix-turn-helix DNA-binding protein n=1 Tax=unclassified Campylobacter TaxID=2593542 RepID=UPI0022EA0A63|nr:MULTISPECIES: sigma factor-like helix-turn-helix DNA-binding protein [unclassified Campylobacter]MDA3053296.1 hypothetical protein [Campylobacter sp. JMF_03 NE3]MDA3067521.1 hypothetical protein [Campylobacter sp. JMF_01 NE2]
MRTRKTINTATNAFTTYQIANFLGISQSTVRKIEKQALMKLSSPTLKDKWQNIIETLAMIDRNRCYLSA